MKGAGQLPLITQHHSYIKPPPLSFCNEGPDMPDQRECWNPSFVNVHCLLVGLNCYPSQVPTMRMATTIPMVGYATMAGSA